MFMETCSYVRCRQLKLLSKQKLVKGYWIMLNKQKCNNNLLELSFYNSQICKAQ